MEKKQHPSYAFISASTCQIPEFDNDLVRRLIAGIRVITADRIEIQSSQES